MHIIYVFGVEKSIEFNCAFSFVIVGSLSACHFCHDALLSILCDLIRASYEIILNMRYALGYVSKALVFLVVIEMHV